MDGNKTLEQKKVIGKDKWMEEYLTVCKDYSLKLMTNDGLKIRVESTYK